MKFSAQREELLKPLQLVNGVVERRQTLPILSNVLLSLGENRLALTGTDLEVEIVVRLALQGGESGQITVPARKFSDICRTLPDGASIEFRLEGDKALIRSGRSRFSLSTLPAAEYPSLEEIEAPLQFEVPQSALRRLIEQTQFSMAQQDVRYYLNGLLLELGDGRLRAVATDGHRLALADEAAALAATELSQVIVPRKGVLELARLLEDSDAPARVRLGSNHLQVELPDVSFTSKLIDGRFPDYGRVLPAPGTRILQCEREALRQALARASVLSNEKYRGVRLQLEDTTLKATVHNPEQEEAEEELEVAYEGEPLEIGFNVSYLLDALGAIKSDRVEISFTDANSSCLLQGTDAPESRYVVMPMRL